MWIVECSSIPGCISQGHNKEEAVLNIKDAIAACLQVRAVRVNSAIIAKDINIELKNVNNKTRRKSCPIRN